MTQADVARNGLQSELKRNECRETRRRFQQSAQEPRKRNRDTACVNTNEDGSLVSLPSPIIWPNITGNITADRHQLDNAR